jgi:NADH-quinone oxidoreductase subunit F
MATRRRSLAVGADEGTIYVRAEYPLAIERLLVAIATAEKAGLLGDRILGSELSFRLHIKKGAGAFVCGEETALMASIEGRRGMPRPRPPFPAESGVFGRPTVLNNVETFANVPRILVEGAAWFAAMGEGASKGTKVFALTGKVVSPGLVEVPMGMTLREVIFDIGGGIPDGKAFKAAQIGGPSGGCIPTEHLDIHITYDTLKTVGAMMGSGGLVVMDEGTCMVNIAAYFMDFITKESCGKCIPCREGTRRMYETLLAISTAHDHMTERESLARMKGVIRLEQLGRVIKDTSLCGLGQSAPNPILSTLRFFRAEYEAHIYDRKCPAGVCSGLLTYRIDLDKCTGCGVCLKRCAVGAIVGEKKRPHYIVADKCSRCGQCRQACAFDAVIAS